MTDNKQLPGPCSERQKMYMFPTTKDGEQVDVTLFGGAAGCLPAETEFLSDTGWVKISEYNKHKVAVFNPEDLKIKFEYPEAYIKLPEKTLKKITGKGMEMVLSDEHKVVYWNDGIDKMQTLSFSEVLYRHNKSKTKGWTGRIRTSFNGVDDRNGIDYNEGELRLQVAAMADGHFVPNGANNYCQIAVSKKRKRDRLVSICEEFSIPYRDFGFYPDTSYSNGGYYKIIVHPKTKEKRYSPKWYNATEEQLAIIADEVAHWDGSITKSGSLRYYSKYEDDASYIQYVFASKGMNTSFVKDNRAGKESYTTNATKFGKGLRSFANKDGNKAPVEEYITTDGFKYCFTVSTGVFIARHNGKIFVTGNSGKSEIGVIDFLKYTDIKNFIGVMTRRTTPQLNGPGGLLTKCKRIFGQAYKPDEFTWRAKDGKFVFHKSGAEIYLKHFENDEADVNWQGTEANLFYVDESTQFTMHMIQYIMSRMRNPSCPQVKPHLKLTCNPCADHGLKKWVEPYLDEDGRPDRSKDGMVRYFSFQDGDFVWGDTKDRLYAEYGIDQKDALSFTFISANVYDNPVVQEVNPKYVSWLKGLKGVEKERLLNGNWNVRESSLGFLKKEWLSPVQLHEHQIVSYCRAWDIAGSLPSDALPNPDWTVGVLIAKTKLDRYIVCDVVRFRARFGEVMQRIISTAKTDPDGARIIIPQEPGQAGKAAGQIMLRDIIGEGFYARMRPSNKSKVVRFQPFAAACEAGLVDYVEADWNDQYFNELEMFDGTRKNKDDQVDATSDAFITLAQKINLPNITAALSSVNLTNHTPFS